MQKLHFISGLPRSGSTLLAALLRQNPKFHAKISSPVFEFFWSFEQAMSRDKETSVFVNSKTRENMLRTTFETYYKDYSQEIIFDTARMWAARVPILASLFPEAKFICCVREVGWILDSFEKLYRKNGQVSSAIYNWNTNGTAWSRAKLLMESDGVIGYSLNAVQEAVASSEATNRVMLIDYEDLCNDAPGALRFIYNFIGEPYYEEHDFNNFHYDEKEFDWRLGAENLHTVNGPVSWQPRNTILPLPLFFDMNTQINNFWRGNKPSLSPIIQAPVLDQGENLLEELIVEEPVYLTAKQKRIMKQALRATRKTEEKNDIAG